MKKLLFLAPLLTFLFISCSKESSQPEENDDSSGPLLFNGFKVTDTTGIILSSVNYFPFFNGQAGLCAVRNNHKNIWIGIYDNETKEEIQTWTGKNPLNQNLGYIIISRAVLTEDGYAISATLMEDKINETKSGILFIDKNKNDILSYDFSHSPYIYLQSFYDKVWVRYSQDIYGERIQTENFLLSSNGTFIANSISTSSWGQNTLLTGFTNEDKLVFYSYSPELELLEEWISNEKIERNIKLHVGYGEYVDYYISNIFNAALNDNQILETEWGYVIQPIYKLNYDNTNHTFTNEVFILNKGDVYTCITTEEVNLYNWYNNSVLGIATAYNSTGFYIYGTEGEIIFQGDKFPYSSLNTFLYYPTSYETFVVYGEDNSLILRGYNIKNDSPQIWYVKLKEIPTNAKVTWNILNHTDTLLTYQVEIIEYDGTKETLNFKIDTETGEVTYL